MSNQLPVSIPWVRVEAALARFGIPLADLRELRLGVSGLTVVQLRRDEDGHSLVIGGEVATITTTIGYDWDGSAQ
ncbi:hypothetical protein GS461_09865 [Rhodococcus hoagii]|nr:hypothetical protein [Prescottella equi]